VDFTVVIPCRNSETHLERCLKSVLQQTLEPTSVIIIDDGSTDQTREIAESHKKNSWKIVSSNGEGLADARNTGLDLIDTNWVAFLDSDDEWLPDKLENDRDIIRNNPSSDVVHSGFALVDTAGNHIITPSRVRSGCSILRPEYMILRRYVKISTASVRYSIAPRFCSCARHSEDIIYFAEISASKRTFVFDPECRTLVSVHSGQMTKQAGPIAVRSFESRARWIIESKKLDPEERRVAAISLLEQLKIVYKLTGDTKKSQKKNDLEKVAVNLASVLGSDYQPLIINLLDY